MMKMDMPGGLAVDKRENMLVSDMLNHGLLVLDRSLTSVHEMPVSVVGDLRGPCCL